MSGTIRRRVWTTARPAPDDDGFRILLDDKPLRLPGGSALRLPSRALADAVAEEWSSAGGGAVGGVFGPDSLVLTRLAGTLQERVTPDRARAIAMLLGYAGGDLLCYRASYPAVLIERQRAAWQPWLDWCAERHGAVMVVTHGVMPVDQPVACVTALEVALQAQDDVALTGLGVLVPALGSLVLGLAVADGVLAASAASELAVLDDQHQIEQWGHDADASGRLALLAGEVDDAARFIALGRSPGGRIGQRWLISGVVQGVGYRMWLEAAAQALDLSGWVRNLYDGRVEALLHGSPERLSELAAAAWQGPRLAVVQAVLIQTWTKPVAGSPFRQVASAPHPEPD